MAVDKDRLTSVMKKSISKLRHIYYIHVYPHTIIVLELFVSDLWQVCGFGYSTNKTDHHDIAEILLKVALNTMTLTLILKLRKIWNPKFGTI